MSWTDDPANGGGRGFVHEVIAIDDATELALWGLVLDIDLVRQWKVEERPVDDVLRSAIHDRRAYAISSVDDEQWVRLVDVDRALRARTYSPVDGAVTIAITDPLIGTNCGTWSVGAHGAARTDEPAALRTDIAGLSAAYLGGTAWCTLAATGRADVLDPDAVALADALFAVRPLPFCGSFF